MEPIESVALVGAGTMGSGVAQKAAQEGFVQYGSWIFIDPDEHLIDLIDEDIDLEALCELIRCDSTDLLNLGDVLIGGGNTDTIECNIIQNDIRKSTQRNVPD